MKSRISCLYLMLMCTTLLAQQATPVDRAVADAAIKQIRPEAIRGHMRFLTDTLLQGRATGTSGYDIAAHYVATELEGMGLNPDGQNRTWFQDVPLRKAIVDEPKSFLVLIHNGKEEELANGIDYVLSGDVVYTDAVIKSYRGSNSSSSAIPVNRWPVSGRA
jgi:hypothetical protein